MQTTIGVTKLIHPSAKLIKLAVIT